MQPSRDVQLYLKLTLHFIICYLTTSFVVTGDKPPAAVDIFSEPVGSEVCLKTEFYWSLPDTWKKRVKW